MSNSNLLSSSLKPLPLVLSLQALAKSPSPASCRPPLSTGRLLEGLPRAFSFPGWTAPALSACPHRRCAPALGSSLWLSSGLAPTGPHPSCAEGCRAGCRTPGGVSLECSKGAGSPPSTCWPHFSWCSSGYSWSSGLRGHIGGSCLAFHPPVSPSPSQQGCSQSLHPPACTDSRGCPDPDKGPCTWPCWTSQGSHGPTSWACPGPSGWHPVLMVCQLYHSAWCHLQTCWGRTWSQSLSHWWKQQWFQYGPLRDTTCHQRPFGHRAFDHYPLAAIFQPIP